MLPTNPSRVYFFTYSQIDSISGSLVRAHSSVQALLRLGHRVTHAYYTPGASEALLSATQASHTDFSWEKINLVELLKHDVLWLSHFWSPQPLMLAVRLVDEVRRLKPGMPIVVDLSDVIVVDHSDGDDATRNIVSYLEGVLLHAANSVALVSDLEKSRAMALYGLDADKITVIPTCHEIRDELAQRSFEERQPHVCMAGTTHPHNLLAFEYAIDDIWPIIRRTAEQSELHVFGKNTDNIDFHADNPGRDISRVKLIGSVVDFQETLSTYRVHLVLTVSGVGVKTKVLDSLASGTPVVGTPKSLEGLELTPGEGVFVSDEPGTLASVCADLLTNKALWNKANRAAVKAALQLGGPPLIEKQCQHALDVALQEPPASSAQARRSVNHVFAFSPGGRSSSTAMQRILNSSNEIRVYGESHGVIDAYLKLIEQVGSIKNGVLNSRITPHLNKEREALKQAFNSGQHNAWYPNGLPDWRESSDLLMRSFEALFPGHPETGRFGFKEISVQDTVSLAMLTTHYHNAYVLIVFRNPVEQWQSIRNFGAESYWPYAGDLEAFVDEYVRLANIYIELHAMRSARTVFIENRQLRNAAFIKNLFSYLKLASFDAAILKDNVGTSNPDQASDEVRHAVEASAAWPAYQEMRRLSRAWKFVSFKS